MSVRNTDITPLPRDLHELRCPSQTPHNLKVSLTHFESVFASLSKWVWLTLKVCQHTLKVSKTQFSHKSAFQYTECVCWMWPIRFERRAKSARDRISLTEIMNGVICKPASPWSTIPQNSVCRLQINFEGQNQVLRACVAVTCLSDFDYMKRNTWNSRRRCYKRPCMWIWTLNAKIEFLRAVCHTVCCSTWNLTVLFWRFRCFKVFEWWMFDLRTVLRSRSQKYAQKVKIAELDVWLAKSKVKSTVGVYGWLSQK